LTAQTYSPIAAEINLMDRVAVDVYKCSALAAARKLKQVNEDQ
jgi:hypothetical protein